MQRPEDPLRDIPQVMAQWNVTERWLRRAVAENVLRYVKIGKQIRFRQSDLDAYVAEQSRGPAQTPQPVRRRPKVRVRRPKAAA